MQDVVPLFDLLSIVAVLAAAVTALRIVSLLIRRRRPQAARVATRWAYCSAVYVAVSIGVSAMRTEHSIGLGERWCFDDWCISVDRVSRRAAGVDLIYTLDLQAHNAARRPQAALHPWMFVRDVQGRHFAPDGRAWVAAVESPIPPYESHPFTVEFHVPADAHQLAFVTNHGSGTPCALVPAVLIIGQGRCLFHKYNSIRLE
jgi:hypothetical protein